MQLNENEIKEYQSGQEIESQIVLDAVNGVKTLSATFSEEPEVNPAVTG